MNREKIESYLYAWAEWRETNEARSEIGYPKSTVEARLFQPPSGKQAGSIVPVSLSGGALMLRMEKAYMDLDDKEKELVNFIFMGNTRKKMARIKAYCQFAHCTERVYYYKFESLLAYYRGYFAATHEIY